jgi:Ca2+-binding RTX toxin-like protein
MPGPSSRPVHAVVDPLESRVLLSVVPVSSIVLSLDAPVVTPAKKSDDQGENGDGSSGKKPKKRKGTPEITVLLNRASLADNSASVDFGRITVGDAAPVRTFTIRNDGTGPLSIGHLSLPAGFTLLDAPASGIDKGGSTTFTVRMDAGAVAGRSGQISFTTNDADEGTFNFTLRGSIVPPSAAELTLLVNGRGILADGTIDFGSAAVGATGPTRTLTIRNDGGAPLTVSRIRLPAGFALAHAPGASLAPGESGALTIRMTTAALGNPSGYLTFRTNDRDESRLALMLTGRVTKDAPQQQPPPTPAATGPRVSVWIPRASRSALPVADGRTDALRFRTTSVGARAPRLTLRVANEGDATLNLGAVQLPAGFVLVEPLASSLAPGASDEFTVALDTSVVATRNGQLTFTTSDPGVPVFNVAIAGTVTPPPVTQPATDLSGSTLVVNGTAGDDTIVVSGKSSSVSVLINGKPMTGSPFSSVTKVVVNAGDGNDHVDLSRLFVNATANGEFGRDILIGTDGDDVLNGGPGDDTLDGRAGDDHLLGGDGNDLLTGGLGLDVFQGEAGNDTLVATDGLADILLDSGAGRDDVRRDRVDPNVV